MVPVLACGEGSIVLGALERTGSMENKQGWQKHVCKRIAS
jgi:hypothetical protein